MKKYISFLLILCLPILGKAQLEFFIHVDYENGTFTKINDIPELQYIQVAPNTTVFDETNGWYIFTGFDIDFNRFLYTIDASTGTKLYDPLFSQGPGANDNVVLYQIDQNTGRMYACHWSSIDNTEYFVTIEPSTGEFEIIAPIPDVQYIVSIPDYSVFDSSNSYYTFGGVPAGGSAMLYTLNAADGSIVYSPPMPSFTGMYDNIGNVQFDNSTGTLYGLHWDDSEQTEYIVSIDRETSEFEKLWPIPGVNYITTVPNYATFAESEGLYIFRGGDSNGNWFLYAVNVNDGSVFSMPEFPVLEDVDDNVIELQYDNVTDTLYGLHWDANFIQPIDTTVMDTTVMDTTVMDTTMMDTVTYIIEEELLDYKIYPNPFEDYLVVELDAFHKYERLRLLNADGAIMRELVLNGQQEIVINTNDFISGIYFIQLLKATGESTTLKVLK